MRSTTSSTFQRLGIGVTAVALILSSACAAKVNDTGAASSASAPSTAASAAAGGSSAAVASAPAATSGAATSGGAAASGSAPASTAKMLPVTGTCSAPVNLAMNDWVGYTADAAVVTYVLQNKLKCRVNQKALAEQLAWQGLPTGQIDVIIENWGHASLTKKYITDQKTAIDAGPTGNLGQIGWYVTPSTL
jgi:ABC-type proline/glycine betaine transport system substrate-binding protein